MEILINFIDLMSYFQEIFDNIFEILMLFSVIIFCASTLLILITRGNKGISSLFASGIAIIICFILNYLIYGEFLPLPSFFQFLKEWLSNFL